MMSKILFKFIYTDRSFIKEIQPVFTVFSEESCYLTSLESDPDVSGTLIGFNLENMLEKKFNPLYKTEDMLLSFECNPQTVREIINLVECEKDIIRNLKKKSLPLFLHAFKTMSGINLLENRLKEK